MLKVNDHCNNILGKARKEHYDVLNKFEVGDPVRLKFNPSYRGYVTHADPEVCRVCWIDSHAPTIQRNEQLTLVSQKYFSKSLAIETKI